MQICKQVLPTEGKNFIYLFYLYLNPDQISRNSNMVF